MADLTDLTRFTSGSIAGRQQRLPGPLRELHRAVLRRFLQTGSPPTARWVRQAAAESGWTPPPWTRWPPPTPCT